MAQEHKEAQLKGGYSRGGGGMMSELKAMQQKRQINARDTAKVGNKGKSKHYCYINIEKSDI